MRYWLNPVHRNHVLAGRSGSFIQADHGKRRSLDRMSAGDYVVFYSPRHSFDDKTPLQRFTAIAQITAEAVYQVELSDDFRPFRRNARYFDCREVEIRPLLDSLTFIENKRQWGYKFRSGVFEISRPDFERIARQMGLAEGQP